MTDDGTMWTQEKIDERIKELTMKSENGTIIGEEDQGLAPKLNPLVFPKWQ